MITRWVLISFLVVSCGERKVKFPSGADAISPYQVTNAEKVKPQTQATFTKTSTINGSTFLVSGKTYPFSEYSSHQALSYYASKKDGSVTQVKYRGEVVKGKLVVEVIEDN